MSSINGVHHVAIGVKDLEIMTRFYQGIGFKNIIAEIEESEKEVMHETVRAASVIFSGVLLGKEDGGMMIELIQMTTPAPRPIRKNFRYGDIGLAKVVIRVPDVNLFYLENKSKFQFCSEPKLAKVPKLGDYYFVYCKDPEGNLIEFVTLSSPDKTYMCSAVSWVGISVTNLERSIRFYQNVLGLHVFLDEPCEEFSGLVDEVADSSGTRVRSCLLGRNETGGGICMVELFEVLEPRGRSIPFGTRWGDYGYLQTCFSHGDVKAAAERFAKEGADTFCELKRMEDGGEFIYWKDPDGIPNEFLYLPS
jgi:catechol 2,3-dioxygenase-like lactoylglutathione lyase family enzyme